MDRETLLRNQQAATARFTELQNQANQKRQEIEQIEDELKRLQGEYRAYEQLLQSLSEAQPQANTITAQPAEEKHGHKQLVKR